MWKGSQCLQISIDALYKTSATLPSHLNKLKGKKEWKWEEEHQRAFEELKEKITSQLVLALPKREGKFRVEIDASGHAIGGVLS